jgi:hypothetical protein
MAVLFFGVPRSRGRARTVNANQSAFVVSAAAVNQPAKKERRKAEGQVRKKSGGSVFLLLLPQAARAKQRRVFKRDNGTSNMRLRLQ